MSLLLTILSAATMITCIFKHYRFIDFVAMELVIFVLAVLVALPVSTIALGQDATMVIGASLVARVLVLLYTAKGGRPNITFFHRVKEGTA